MSDKIYSELPRNINTLENEKFTLDDDGFVEIRSGEGTGTVYSELPRNINTLEKEKFVLDDDGRVAIRLKSSGGGIVKYANLAAFPAVGKDTLLYLASDTGILYTWETTVYVAVSTTLALGETSTTAYRGDRGKTAYDHSQTTHDKAFVGLGSVDNTSDIDKPVSTAQATAIGLKVTANTAITEATKTKITYDSKGLVTAGADAAIADITGLTDALNAKIAGPAVATDNSIARFDGITGKVIQDGSLCYIDDTGKMGINVVSPTASLDIKGLGATSATKAFIAKNSAGTELFTVDDSGRVFIKGQLSSSDELYAQIEDSKAGFENRNASHMLDGDLLNYANSLIISAGGTIVKNVTSPSSQGAKRLLANTNVIAIGTELIPIDTTAWYRMKSEMLLPSTNAKATGFSYYVLSCYDAEKLIISVADVSFIKASITYLAKNIVNGDTVIYLKHNTLSTSTNYANESLSVWKKRSDGIFRYIGNGGSGKVYDDTGYTRNRSRADSWNGAAADFNQPYIVTAGDVATGLWDSDIVEGTTVYRVTFTNSVDYNGSWQANIDQRGNGVTFDAGDKVSNGAAGQSYKYFGTSPVINKDDGSNTWKIHTTNWYRGVDLPNVGTPDQSSDGYVKAFRQGTTYVNVGGLFNYGGTTGDLLYVGVWGLEKKKHEVATVGQADKLGINTLLPTATLQVTGSGATSATKAMIVKNSAGTNILTACDCGAVGIGTQSPTSNLQVVGLPTYADNTTALAGGLTAGAFYKTAVGVLMVTY